MLQIAGNVNLWQNQFNYGMAMACLSLLLPFPLFFFVRWVCDLATACTH